MHSQEQGTWIGGVGIFLPVFLVFLHARPSGERNSPGQILKRAGGAKKIP
jgi:hypothetical protein